MTDIGVANPSAHGHAIISTATALMMAWGKRGSGPNQAHPRKVKTAMASTAGTK